ncbi:MAG TPA: NADH-quinone oxidoreductase subunit C, partial [Rhodopila sp.]|nr:NADH-quinone oxidoreductase subunit C [Rhodopila sp.]
MSLAPLIAAGTPVPAHRPWPRVVVNDATWAELGRALAGGDLTLLSLWGEPGVVHLAIMSGREVGVFSLSCPDLRCPSIGRQHAPAIRLERTAQDLFGIKAVDLPDPRPWVDHGRWSDDPPAAYDFLPVEGAALHQVPVGPVHAGIIEPGHFRFACDGETVV